MMNFFKKKPGLLIVVVIGVVFLFLIFLGQGQRHTNDSSAQTNVPQLETQTFKFKNAEDLAQAMTEQGFSKEEIEKAVKQINTTDQDSIIVNKEKGLKVKLQKIQ